MTSSKSFANDMMTSVPGFNEELGHIIMDVGLS
jgi:hypothetical protein